jgi:hypothetical protein
VEITDFCTWDDFKDEDTAAKPLRIVKEKFHMLELLVLGTMNLAK